LITSGLPLRSLGEGGTMRYFVEKNPELKLHALPIEQTNAK
jgi:hypothetical protein